MSELRLWKRCVHKRLEKHLIYSSTAGYPEVFCPGGREVVLHRIDGDTEMLADVRRRFAAAVMDPHLEVYIGGDNE